MTKPQAEAERRWIKEHEQGGIAMSLYAVKNDKGEWLGWEVYQVDPDFIGGGGSVWNDLDKAKFYAKANGGHVVELVEFPANVVLTKEQAEIVEGARDSECPAAYISVNADEERLLMKALINGYTVEKEKKYYVRVPLVQAQGGLWFFINSEDKLDATWLKELAKKFTIEEIEHYGLQDCEKVEVEQDAE